MNYTDGKPVAGVHFEIKEVIGVGIGWVGIGHQEKAGEATSGPDGSFAINLKYRKGKKFEYALRMLNDAGFEPDSTREYQEYYFIQTPYDNAYYLKEDKTEYCEFEVLPAARLKAVVKDVFPYNDVDLLYIQATDAIGYQGNGLYSLDDGFSKYQFIPTDGKVYIKYTKGKGGINYEYTEVIDAVPFKKTTFYLEY